MILTYALAAASPKSDTPKHHFKAFITLYGSFVETATNLARMLLSTHHKLLFKDNWWCLYALLEQGGVC